MTSMVLAECECGWWSLRVSVSAFSLLQLLSVSVHHLAHTNAAVVLATTCVPISLERSCRRLSRETSQHFLAGVRVMTKITERILFFVRVRAFLRLTGFVLGFPPFAA